MKKRHLVLAGFLLLVATFAHQLKKRQYKATRFDDSEEVIVKQKRSKRIPASLQMKSAKQPVPTKNSSFTWTERTRPKDKNEFAEPTGDGEEAIAASEIENNTSNHTTNFGTNSSTRNGNTTTPAAPSKSAGNTSKTSGLPSYVGVNQPTTSPTVKTEPPKETSTNTNPTPRDNETPVCSSSSSGGTFNGPVSVTLTCSTTSTIKYCVSENTCCDPDSGSLYSGPIQIGQPAKTFCLSFSGTTLAGGIISQTTEAQFQFDPEVPDIHVVQEKAYVQTTQLDALLRISSNDFGSQHHSVGIINLKTHDTSSSGLNMSCQDVIENHTALTGPVTLNVLSETAVASYSPSSELNMSLAETSLIYGENNLTSYLKSTQYTETKYTCSQTKLVLEDFYYSQTLPIDVAAAADSSVLSGGFDYIAPLDVVPNIYRGPASDVDSSSSQQIRTGLWSIFFDK